MKKILVTGGAGYIGSHTLLELAKGEDIELVVFDNLKNGHRRAVEIVAEHTGKQIDVVEGDLLNYAEIAAAVEKYQPNMVIHFAALIEAGVSMQFPLRFFENNFTGSLNLLKAMAANNVRKLVFSSTAAVYGTPETMKVTEDNKLSPESVYGDTKYMVELMLKKLATADVDASEKIDSICLRYFNAAGANPQMLLGQDYPKPTHLITLAIQSALGMRDGFTIFGNDYDTPDGTCIRDYIHVQDLAKAHVAAVNYLGNHNGYDAFNIGTGHGVSNLEVVKMLEEIHGSFKYDFGPRRPGDAVAYYADCSKALNALGWKPEFDLRQIVEHSYNWQKSHPNGYGDK